MFKIFTFIACAILLTSCGSDRKEGIKTLSHNKEEIKEYYQKLGALLHKPSDSTKKHLEKMKVLVENESGDYKAMYYIASGIYNINLSAHVLAKRDYDQALHYLEKSKTDSLISQAYSGIGALNKNTGDYGKAIQYLFKAQKIYRKTGDKRGIAIVNGSLGQIYQQRNEIEPAKEYLAVALEAMKHNKSHFAYMNAAHTLANIHGMAGEFDKALAIDNELIKICDSIDSPKLKSPFYDNKANCFMYSNQLDSAKVYFNKCLDIDLAVNNPKQIADTYCNLGNLAMFKKDYATAEKYLLQSISILKGVDHKPNLLKSYKILGDILVKQERYREALELQMNFQELYRKMVNEKSEQAIAEYKVVYETGEKERIIAQNKVDLLVKEREVQNKSILLIVISVFALFIAIVAFLIYRQQKLKNVQQQQEHELKTAISQIETQNKLQEQRLSISRDLHDNIGAQLTFIISSVDNIRYAFDLKNTKLESRLQHINSFTKATIVELRDTIWAMNNSEISFEDLSTRIYNFIENAKDATENISFNFELAKGISKMRLSSVAGMNIYRTIQEAINNAIKSAAASKITVTISQNENLIKIQIRDNGNGFDLLADNSGNGLLNMKKRITEIDGEFLIESDSSGTSITILVKKQAIVYSDTQ